MTTLTIVTFEPNTVGFYVDGELDELGEKYMEPDILSEYLVIDVEIDKVCRDHYNFGRWKGIPNTLDQCEEMYGE